MNLTMKFNIFVVAAALAVLMPLITANNQDNEKQAVAATQHSDHGNDGSAELLSSGDNEAMFEKRYRLMGKRLSSSDEDEDELANEMMEKRYRLMGKRYRLMGKRYRLMGKRSDELLSGEELLDDDEAPSMDKRYRLMGKRYRLMGRNNDLDSVKRYRIYGK